MHELSKDLCIVGLNGTEAKAEVAGAVIAHGLRHHARSLGALVRSARVVF
jgi:hypothetical protein